MTSQNLWSVQGNATSTYPFLTVMAYRDPDVHDLRCKDGPYQLGQRWINRSTNQEWYFDGSISTSGEVLAVWRAFTPSGYLALQTITGTTGGPIFPDSSFNINLLGTNVLAIGDPLTHTITLTALSGEVTWTTISGNTSLTNNTGYFCTSGTNLQLTLPTSSVLGDCIEISLDGATKFTVIQGSGQQIRYGNQQTTLGAGGSLASTDQGDSIRMVCSATNTKWNVISSIGNLTVT
jgi:hypothetical protein